MIFTLHMKVTVVIFCGDQRHGEVVHIAGDEVTILADDGTGGASSLTCDGEGREAPDAQQTVFPAT